MGHKRALKLDNYTQDCYLSMNSMGEDRGSRRSLAFVRSILPGTVAWAGQREMPLGPPSAMLGSEVGAEALPSSGAVLAAL